MMEAKTNKEFIAKARQAAEFVDPPAAVHDCLDRLETADAEISRLRGLIVWLDNFAVRVIDYFILALTDSPEKAAIDRIIKEERGEK